MLTADKVLVMVSLDKQDYINKAQDLLSQKDTYRSVTADPTNNIKKNSLTCLGLLRVRED